MSVAIDLPTKRSIAAPPMTKETVNSWSWATTGAGAAGFVVIRCIYYLWRSYAERGTEGLIEIIVFMILFVISIAILYGLFNIIIRKAGRRAKRVTPVNSKPILSIKESGAKQKHRYKMLTIYPLMAGIVAIYLGVIVYTNTILSNHPKQPASAGEPGQPVAIKKEKTTTNSKEPRPSLAFKNKEIPQISSYDPAEDVAGKVYYFDDPVHLNLNSSDYRYGAGDLARIQYRLLKDRNRAKEYPSILIGDGSWGSEACNQGLPTLGLYRYSVECNQLITVNFSGNGMTYEHPIEVLTTLAHEWGHHIVNLSGKNISGISNELLSDCYAGIYLAYLDKHNKITKEELFSTIRMMGVIGSFEGGVHGTPAQRRNGLMSGALYMSDTNNQKGEHNWNKYCKELDDIIDVQRGLP